MPDARGGEGDPGDMRVPGGGWGSVHAFRPGGMHGCREKKGASVLVRQFALEEAAASQEGKERNAGRRAPPP